MLQRGDASAMQASLAPPHGADIHLDALHYSAVAQPRGERHDTARVGQG